MQIPDEKLSAAIETARIAAALDAYHSSRIPADDGESFREPDNPSLTGELAWLTAVARAYRTSPLVPTLLTALQEDSSATPG